eukprot:5964639-Pyramimonas_sp.AAC.1
MDTIPVKCKACLLFTLWGREASPGEAGRVANRHGRVRGGAVVAVGRVPRHRVPLHLHQVGGCPGGVHGIGVVDPPPPPPRGG